MVIYEQRFEKVVIFSLSKRPSKIKLSYQCTTFFIQYMTFNSSLDRLSKFLIYIIAHLKQFGISHQSNYNYVWIDK